MCCLSPCCTYYSCTVDAGYFIVPDNFVSLNNVNESVVEVYAKVKYQGIKIGEAADGPVHHLDMDDVVYPEVTVVRSCIRTIISK